MNRRPTLVPREVSAKLTYSWSYYGLRLGHLIAPLVLGYFMVFASFVIGFSMIYAAAVAFATLAGTAVLQVRQGPDYLSGLLIALLTPRRLTCFRDDTTAYVLPVGQDDELLKLERLK